MPKKNSLDIKFDSRNLKNDDDLRFFVKNGFVIYKNIFDRKIIDAVKNNILGSFKNLSQDYKKKRIDLNSWKWSKAISINHEKSFSADKFYKSKYLIEVVSIIYNVFSLSTYPYPCIFVFQDYLIFHFLSYLI